MTSSTTLSAINLSISRRIETARRQSGLSVANLAKLIGCKPQHIMQIEAGIVHVKAAQIVMIADVLEISPVALLTRDKVTGTDEVDSTDEWPRYAQVS